MNSSTYISIILIFLIVDVFAQTLEIKKTSEEIFKFEKKEQINRLDLFAYIGNTKNNLIYYFKDREMNTRKIYRIQVPNYLITKISDYDFLLDDFVPFTNINLNRSCAFYSTGILNGPDEYGYQKIYLNYFGRDFLLDSIYNADKKIHSSFSADGRYLLVNTLNTLSDYYNPEQDNRIMVYDLSEIEKGKVDKQYIPCTHCSDSYLIGDQLFFTIGRKDGYDGFSNKDIYVAPWGSLKDSVKIARNTDIKAISPDGQSLLGIRFWDRQQNTAVVVDVKQRKYQMLLGRDYAKRKAFYSYYEKKFAFDFKGYLIYVALPESYPFDALEWRNEEIPDWTNKEFWKQFEHSPLSED